MSELPDRVPGEIIFASFSNQLIHRSVQRYADDSQRNALNPVPEDGDLAFITSTEQLQIYDGFNWFQMAAISDLNTGLALKVDRDGDTMTGDLRINLPGQDHVGIGLFAGAAAQSGGAARFGFSNRTVEFARIQGQGSDSGNNTSGGLGFFCRTNATDSALTEFFRILRTGAVRLLGGGEIEAYDPAPVGGGDIYAFQMRNVQAEDQPPDSGDGIDGDVFIHYDAGAGVGTGAKVYVKVNGAWKGGA